MTAARWLPSGDDLPLALRNDLIRYLLATSQERAHIMGDLATRNPEMMALLIDLETDDDLRAKLEIALLRD